MVYTFLSLLIDSSTQDVTLIKTSDGGSVSAHRVIVWQLVHQYSVLCYMVT